MIYDFTRLSISADGDVCKKAAALFAEEMEMRTGSLPAVSDKTGGPCVQFEICEGNNLPGRDSYKLELA